MRIEPHFWPAVECSGFEQKLFDTQLAIILGCHEQLTVCQFGVKQVHGHCSCNLEQLVQGTHTFCCNTACMRTLGSIFSSVSRMQVLYATFADNQLAGSIPVMSNITLGLNMSSNRFSTVSFEVFANSLQLALPIPCQQQPQWHARVHTSSQPHFTGRVLQRLLRTITQSLAPWNECTQRVAQCIQPITAKRLGQDTKPGSTQS